MNRIPDFFFDEVIFQLTTSTSHTWAPKDKRILLPGQLSKKKIIEMGAVEPETGESFHLFMPFTTKVTFRIFVEELSKVYPNHKIVLIHDGAPWHQIESPCDNIELWQMPAYSPELNPIERLWKWIRENLLHNRFFNSLEELEQTLCQFLQDVSTLKQTILSVCTICYKECSGE